MSIRNRQAIVIAIMLALAVLMTIINTAREPTFERLAGQTIFPELRDEFGTLVPTATSTSTPTSTPTITPTITLTPTPTITPTITLTPTPTRTRPTNALSVPYAPVIDSLNSYVTAICTGDCTCNNPPKPSYAVSTFTLVWNHQDPPSVDYYEIWMVDDPYVESVGNCSSGCDLVATTTALARDLSNTPPTWQIRAGIPGAFIQQGPFFFRLRAVNRAGASEDSNTIGIVQYSLLQCESSLPW